METIKENTKIVFVSADGNEVAINVILSNKVTPSLVYFKNTKNYTLGKLISVTVSNLRVVEQILPTSEKRFTFGAGECNFKIVPEFYKAKIVYVSKNGKYGAISVYLEDNQTPVLAFFPKKEFRKKGDVFDFPTNLKVAPRKKDDKIFYFVELGICNFTIAHTVVRSKYTDDSYSHYDEAKDDYYENLGNSVCEYCGECGCSCQRDLDNQN